MLVRLLLAAWLVIGLMSCLPGGSDPSRTPPTGMPGTEAPSRPTEPGRPSPTLEIPPPP